MEVTLDERDKTFLREKYSFDRDDFFKVQRLIDVGFSIMKAAKIVDEKKQQNNGGE